MLVAMEASIKISKPVTAILAEKVLVARVVTPPTNLDELSHNFVRGKEIHDDHHN